MRRWWNELLSEAILNESMATFDVYDGRKPTRVGFVLITLADRIKLKWIDFACFHFGHKVKTEDVAVENGAIESWHCARCGTGGTHIWG